MVPHPQKKCARTPICMILDEDQYQIDAKQILCDELWIGVTQNICFLNVSRDVGDF